jgi:hypothetical protein
MADILSDLVDARRMARLHPMSFTVPTDQAIAALTAGDCVKICRHEERFWILVVTVNGDEITGSINNTLVMPGNADLQAGDHISLRRKHIYAISTGR